MAIRIIFIIFLFVLVHFPAFGQNMQPETTNFKEDFEYFWQSVKDDYCYFDKKKTDWGKVKEIYSPQVDTITTTRSFILLLEKVFNELYDHHASLNSNTKNSYRLVPSRTDIWAEYIDGKPVITQVRRNFGAFKSGITPGMEVIAVNDVPVNEAVQTLLPKSLTSEDLEANNYALRLLLAGDHITPRKLSLKLNDKTSEYFPDESGMLLENIKYDTKVESNITGNIGYIKINNCLFDNELIPAFDSIMNIMSGTDALIFDLRETPSGGNTTVARAILGWFTNKDKFFQKHELTAEERQRGIKRSWMEIVSPREGKYYDKPLVVLAGRWTGSVGEGIVIGFDALSKTNPASEITIMGTKLAGLNGAIYSYEMPNTKIGFSFPVEKLFHIDGTPRKSFTPPNFIDLIKLNTTSDNNNIESNLNEDVILNEAILFLKNE